MRTERPAPDTGVGATLGYLGSVLALLLCTQVATPRLPTLNACIAVSLSVAAAGIVVTAALWPGSRTRWRGHRRGLALAVGTLLLAAGGAVLVDYLDVGLRGLRM